jgi:conjugative transposon TraK protein
MPFIEDLDKKRKYDTYITVGAIVGSLICCAIVVASCLSFAQKERERIYVLDEDTPLMARQTEQEITVDVEAKAHINLFHMLFFTLAPDDKFINYNLERAMYLCDESGLAQRNTLQEKGFYSSIISASAMFSIITDSIQFDKKSMKFVYYGRQRIERRTTILYRELVTEGKIVRTQRTENNPHGMIITGYRTIRNKDLESRNKSTY